MVLKEWAAVRKLYKASKRHLFKTSLARTYRFMLAISISAVPLFVAFRYAWITNSLLLIPLAVGIGLFFIGADVWRIRLLGKLFEDEYEQHGIADLPFFKPEQYLRYAFFLRELAKQPWSHDYIKKLSSFAETLPKPEPPLRLFQQPLVTTITTISIAVLLDIIRLPESWQTGRGVTLVRCVGSLILAVSLLGFYRKFRYMPITKHEELQRFVQWAEMDTEEPRPDHTANGALSPSAAPAYPANAPERLRGAYKTERVTIYPI